MAVDDLTLKVNGTAISGWTSVRVTRGVERMPSDFDISLTERFPDEPSKVVVQPGDKCEVLLGSDLVITGYVNRLMPSIGKDVHSIRLVGRSKSQDLVDCAAHWEGGQFANRSALQIAQLLAKPFGIEVSSTAQAGPTIPQFNLIIGETPFDIIERVSRAAAVVAYDKPDGSIVLAHTGSAKAASGFKQGVNVESATLTRADDQTFSEYAVFGLSMSTFLDAGVLNQPLGKEIDPNVKRFRGKYFVADGSAAGFDQCTKRAQWEAARRHGRSWRVDVVVDSWRDAAGKLWEPNTLAVVDLPAINVVGRQMCIGEVTYRRDDRGTTAEITLMLPEAFLPQPINLLPFLADAVPAGRP